MNNKNTVGRPKEMTIRKMERLAEALKNNYSVTDSCEWAGISKDTYYRYMRNNEIFSNKMKSAIELRNKVSFNFRTTF